jgi:hypothetical protein
MRDLQRGGSKGYGTNVMPLYRGARRPFIEPTEEAAPLNWRRGFFRVWLLVSAAWIMGWAIYLALYAIQGGFKSVGEILVMPILFLGPPLALFLFGLATAWAFRGFVVDDDPPNP